MADTIKPSPPVRMKLPSPLFFVALSFIVIPFILEVRVMQRDPKILAVFTPERLSETLFAFFAWFAIFFVILFRKNGKNMHSLLLGIPVALVGAVLYLVTIDVNGAEAVLYGGYWSDGEVNHAAGPFESQYPREKAMLLFITGVYLSLAPSLELSVLTATWVALYFGRIIAKITLQ